MDLRVSGRVQREGCDNGSPKHGLDVDLQVTRTLVHVRPTGAQEHGRVPRWHTGVCGVAGHDMVGG